MSRGSMDDFSSAQSQSERRARTRYWISPCFSILLSIPWTIIDDKSLRRHLSLDSPSLPFPDMMMESGNHQCTIILILLIQSNTTRDQTLPLSLLHISIDIEIKM